MAIKLLENTGIENTGIGASALNNLITGNKSGIVGNYLNECAFTATGNTIIIDKGLLIICGRQLEINAIESITLSSLPSEDVRYQIVIELIREESGEVTASIFARQPSTLIQENLLKDGFVYQFELGRVTHKTTGQVVEALRTADVLYGQSGAGAEIEVGEVNTQMISTELPAEVNINKSLDNGKTKLNFDFSLPKPYEDSVTGLVYSSQIVGNPISIQNTNDGFVDKVKITNDTASAISSPLTLTAVNKNLFDTNKPYSYLSNGTTVTVDNDMLTVANTSSTTTTPGVIYTYSNLPIGTYTVKCNFVSNIVGPERGRFRIYKNSTATLLGAIYFTGGSFTFNVTADTTAIVLLMYSSGAIGEAGSVSYSNIQLEKNSTATEYTAHQSQDISIPLKDTSGTVLDLNPADVIEMIDGKYHLNDIELADESQDALRSIPTCLGETNLFGDQPFTFDVTELAMGTGEKKYVALKDQDGNTVMPATEADVVLMKDGKTVQYHLDKSGVIYDQVIRTQTDFETLISSPTWLGAESVALIGQFVYDEPDNSGIKIPSTVKQIHGFNRAKITVMNFVYNATTAKGGLWYDQLPTTNDYSIRDLAVDCTGTGTGGSEVGHGFGYCSNLTNCTGKGTGSYGFGFYDCSNLTNCTGTGTGTNGYGFYNCSNLTNCTGTGTGGSGVGYGFGYCSNLTNCTGRGTGSYGFGFEICTNLTNCNGMGTGTGTAYVYGFYNCTHLTNCTGTGTGTTNGYGFYGIVKASNCSDGGSSTAMWGGTNKNIDIETCRFTPVEASLTTLNT